MGTTGNRRQSGCPLFVSIGNANNAYGWPQAGKNLTVSLANLTGANDSSGYYGLIRI
jgi:hypothetical protein